MSLWPRCDTAREYRIAGMALTDDLFAYIDHYFVVTQKWQGPGRIIEIRSGIAVLFPFCRFQAIDQFLFFVLYIFFLCET